MYRRLLEKEKKKKEKKTRKKNKCLKNISGGRWFDDILSSGSSGLEGERQEMKQGYFFIF